MFYFYFNMSSLTEPQQFFVLLILALIASSLGFIKFLYFISVGYGLSIAVMGLADFFLFKYTLTLSTMLLNILLIIYGCRLAGYLLYRDLKLISFGEMLKKELKKESEVGLFVRILIWISCALLYFAMMCPVFFRMVNLSEDNLWSYVGIFITAFGIILESAADHQKAEAKKKDPKRFVSNGLYKIVRCPNYLGEIFVWTGIFVSGFGSLEGKTQWITAIVGYFCIVWIMFGGARRLELRQKRNHGQNPEYIKYINTTPILLPFVPLYSVEKYWWLVG